MKVLAKGSGAKGWSREMKCTGNGNGGGGCGAKLLVERNDLFITRAFEREGDGEMFVTFKCPECMVLTDIDKPQMPPSAVMSTLPDRQTWERHRTDG